MRLAFFLVPLLSLIPALTSRAQTTEPVVIPPDADASITSNDAVDGVHRANGKGTFLLVGTDQFGIASRALLRFSSESVPGGVIVEDARLVLRGSGLEDADLSIYRLSQPWSEGETAAADKTEWPEAGEDDVTWFYRRYSETEAERLRWERRSGGGDFDRRAALGHSIDGDRGEVVLGGEDFVRDVQAWLSAPESHPGWILVGNESRDDTLLCFGSREEEIEGQRPTLELSIRFPDEIEAVLAAFADLRTLAGAGESGARDDFWKPAFEGGAAMDAELSRPNAAAEDYLGNIIIADTYADAIRRVSPDGIITTIAGSGETGFDGDGPALEQALAKPNALHITPDNTVYFLDRDNDRIRKVTPDGQLVTVVHDLEGIERGQGLWVSDDHGLIYYSSLTRIRRWRSGTAEPETLAEGFSELSGLDVRAETGGASTAEVLVADQDAGAVFLVGPDGVRTRVAGGNRRADSGPALEIKLDGPRGVAWLNDETYLIGTQTGGNLWFVDSDNFINRLINGNGNQESFRGEGDWLADLYRDQTQALGPVYSVSFGPAGRVVMAVNDSGRVRVVHNVLLPGGPRTPVRILPTADASITSADADAGIAYGNGRGPLLLVGTDGFGTANRALLRFSRQDVPPGAILESARLVLRGTGLFNTGIAVHRLDREWSEGPSAPADKFEPAEAGEGDATWFYRRYSESESRRRAWETELGGGDFDPDAVLGESGIDAAGEFIIDEEAFVEDVRNWFRNPDHPGWILVGNELQANTLLCLGSRENGDEEERPYLELHLRKPEDVDLLTWTYSTLTSVAGAGQSTARDDLWHPSFEGEEALSVELSRPNMAAEDYLGNIIIADTYADAIRVVSPGGILTTMAGSGDTGFDGDGPALDHSLAKPNALHITSDNTVYFLDRDNDRIRKVTPDGQLVTVVHDPEGIERGQGLWVSDDHALIYYSSLTRIRRWEAGMTDPETLSEGFRGLSGLDVRSATGNLLAADLDAGSVFLVTPDGERTKVAGGDRRVDSGPALEVRLDGPRGAAWLSDETYVIGTQTGGALWYVDGFKNIHRLVNGNGGQEAFGGEGNWLGDLYREQAQAFGPIYAVKIGPGGSIVATVNDSGRVRVIRKLPQPTNFALQPISSGGYAFTWDGAYNAAYVVETSADLSNWGREQRVIGSGARSVYFYRVMPVPEQYFRVRLFP